MKKLVILTLMLSVSINVLASTERLAIAGNENAPLTIQIFSDFTCPYCAKGEINVKQILKDYPQSVRIVFRNRPLDVTGSDADKAARAFSAVYLQSPALAYNYQAELFQHQADFVAQGETFLYDLAGKLNIDVSRLKQAMKSPEVDEIITEDKALAQQMKIRGVPAFLVGNTFFTGIQPYKEVKAAIERQISEPKNCNHCSQ